jgi:O-antigen/teichoic acid export membrane protein
LESGSAGASPSHITLLRKNRKNESMPNPPRPTWLLILNALAVMTGCLVLFAYFAWVLVTKYQPILVFVAPLMLCVPLLIGAMQYRAVFRRSENAARNVGKYLFIAGGLLAIFFAMMTFIYASNEKEVEPLKLEISSCLTAASLYLLYCGHANQCWAKQLQEAEAEESEEAE